MPSSAIVSIFTPAIFEGSETWNVRRKVTARALAWLSRLIVVPRPETPQPKPAVPVTQPDCVAVVFCQSFAGAVSL